MCKTIKQKVKFKAPPKVIYDLLADEKKHSAVVGRKASISKNIGGKFHVGSASGVNVDLAPGIRIVQAWRRKDFPAGIFSMAAFTFKATANGGTELVLVHRGVPKDLIPDVEEEWRRNYWDRVKKYLTKMTGQITKF